ncbi:MAG TPA: hypothetical protein VHW09_24840 [Bryobacteraceae bacterium]|nr:hypothetical protein [Bryobacteraceae bacterium]
MSTQDFRLPVASRDFTFSAIPVWATAHHPFLIYLAGLLPPIACDAVSAGCGRWISVRLALPAETKAVDGDGPA